MTPFVPDEDLREELHEMLVPAVLKESWNKLEDLVTLSAYYFQFDPEPNDRIYRSFGLFVKAPLPAEAETMELDLHLAHGRSVMTKLVPSGFAEFVKDEVDSCFKILLTVIEPLSVYCNSVCRSCWLKTFKKCSSSSFWTDQNLFLNLFPWETMILADRAHQPSTYCFQ